MKHIVIADCNKEKAESSYGSTVPTPSSGEVSAPQVPGRETMGDEGNESPSEPPNGRLTGFIGKSLFFTLIKW